MKYLISDIEKLYPNWYDAQNELSYEDQKWIWENLPLSEEDEERLRELKKQENTNEHVLNESVNGSSKLQINDPQKITKIEAISALKRTTYKTPPKEIATYLEFIFEKNRSKTGHWLYIAQNYTPKTIHSVIHTMLKQHARGETTINNAAAYFTHCIKFRKKRKSKRNKKLLVKGEAENE